MNRVVREVSEPRLLAMLLDERQRLLREPAHAFVAGLVVVWFGRIRIARSMARPQRFSG